MKKLRKLLAGFMVLAMVVTMLPMLAPITVNATGTKMPTIDTDSSKTGSLTIHKYEYNGNGGTATGEDSDEDSITVGTGDNDAKALADVKFRITWYAKLDTYYTKDGVSLPTLDEAANAFGNLINTQKVDTNITALYQYKEVITDDDGTVTIENLPLGIYLVEEIDAPAQITEKTAPFWISIPMTNADEDDWLYDVHVFPKNKSTYASVTLLKQGSIGNVTASGIGGATFQLQRYDNTSSKWIPVVKNNKGNNIDGTDDENSTGTLTSSSVNNEVGKITVSDLAPGKYRFVEMGVPNDTGYIMNGAETYEFEIAAEDDIGDNISKGDVVIDGEKASNSPHFTVTNYKPNVVKEVQNSSGAWGDNADYGKGTAAENKIPYRIKVDVPQNINELRNFTLSDTMTKQTLVADSFKICRNADCGEEILNGSYTKPTSGNTWSVSFNRTVNGLITSVLNEYAGQSIYIYYEATLTDDAVTTSVGNPNTVTLTYSNQILPESNTDGNPNSTDDPAQDNDDPETDTITDQAVVYTFKIAVEKQDASNGDKKLNGVKFDLYQKVADGASGNDVVDSTAIKGLPSGKYKKIRSDLETTGTDNSSNPLGTLSIHGLSNGTYYLVETKTVDGYNLLKAPYEIKISAEYATSSTTETKTENGTTTTTTTLTNTKYVGTGTNGLIETVVIKNSKGFNLPTTGGVGTYIFIFVGVSMMAAAVILFIISKRKDAAKRM